MITKYNNLQTTAATRSNNINNISHKCIKSAKSEAIILNCTKQLHENNPMMSSDQHISPGMNHRSTEQQTNHNNNRTRQLQQHTVAYVTSNVQREMWMK